MNCADNYKNNIDCQWIDITDLKPGNYSMRVVVNTQRLVPESDYSNNAVFCKLNFNGMAASAYHCEIGKWLNLNIYEGVGIHNTNARCSMPLSNLLLLLFLTWHETKC